MAIDKKSIEWMEGADPEKVHGWINELIDSFEAAIGQAVAKIDMLEEKLEELKNK